MVVSCGPPTLAQMCMFLTESSAMELNIAIVCASLPFAKPLLRSIFPRLFRSGISPSHPFRAKSGIPDFSGVFTQTDIQLTESNGTAMLGCRNSILVSDSQEEIMVHN